MGSATKTTGGDSKKHRKQQRLRPKNPIVKKRTQDKNPPKKTKDKKKKKSSDENKNTVNSEAPKTARKREIAVAQWATASQQLSFFINQYESANRIQLSSLELDSLQETRMLELGQGPAQKIAGNLGEHVKVAFGSSWKEVLCGKNLKEGQVDPGCPALLVISSSALRSLDLIREFRSLTKECHAAKLFSKHMKVEEQVSILKNRVNIACGTPSRIKKLIDMEALGLSRLAVIVFDMHTDVKGYSLFTLPQVRDEFWDLYKSYFHQPLLEGNLRLCLYGPVPINVEDKKSELSDD